MILRRSERDDARAVGKREEARFLTGHELLDHDFGPCIAEPATEHVLDCGSGLFARFGNDDALARSKTVGLDHDRQAEARQVCERRVHVIMPRIRRSRDMGARAQILGKAFGPFELRGRGTWAEDGDARTAQDVGKTIDQRTFRADYDQTDIVARTERYNRCVIGDVQIDQFRFLGNAGVARARIECIAQGRLRELPCQRMLASAAADQKDIHGRRHAPA